MVCFQSMEIKVARWKHDSGSQKNISFINTVRVKKTLHILCDFVCENANYRSMCFAASRSRAIRFRSCGCVNLLVCRMWALAAVCSIGLFPSLLALQYA